MIVREGTAQPVLEEIMAGVVIVLIGHQVLTGEADQVLIMVVLAALCMTGTPGHHMTGLRALHMGDTAGNVFFMYIVHQILLLAIGIRIDYTLKLNSLFLFLFTAALLFEGLEVKTVGNSFITSWAFYWWLDVHIFHFLLLLCSSFVVALWSCLVRSGQCLNVVVAYCGSFWI